jgi:dTDP-4-amino-4,6-dideoxygalactose transaminase
MAETIPFGNLATEVREIRGEIDRAVARVLDSGWFILGAEGERFEKEFAAFVGAGHAVGCGNGTDAITLALLALGLGPGDEVITVANTCVPTATGIRDAGCTLRLVDCDPATLQMDPAALERGIGPRTRAVIPVHLYGSCPDMGRITRICGERKIPVVEDCAQAHGARWGDRGAGQWGILAAWSFYPSKNLGAYGDGGAVTTSDQDLAQSLKRLRNYGQRVRYYHDDEGRNSRLDELQSAILRLKLPHLQAWNARRCKLADMYDHKLRGVSRLLTIPQVLPHCTPARHLYPIRVACGRRDFVRTSLEQQGVQTQIHYPVPLHLQMAFARFFEGEKFSASEAAAGELISLPLYPQLAEGQVARVCEVLLTVLRSLE